MRVGKVTRTDVRLLEVVCSSFMLKRSYWIIFGLNEYVVQMLDIKDLPDFCMLFRHSLAADEPVQVWLDIDAMSMEPIAVGDRVCNHVLLFELLPLSGRMKLMSIHLMPWSSGNAK